MSYVHVTRNRKQQTTNPMAICHANLRRRTSPRSSAEMPVEGVGMPYAGKSFGHEDEGEK